jgi:ABC-2 type transport system ATP-binding protein
MKDNAPIIHVMHLCKQYRNQDEPSVADVSFTVQAGEIMALIGPNGAGKTTTIKMLLGLITPTSGQAQICGWDMSQERERQQGAASVGAILEGARNVYWRLSPRANLAYFGALRGWRGRALRNRTDELLALLQLTEVADKEVRFFSRGMQQKVAIAVAMLHDPAALLLDEPTIGLDVQAAKILEETILLLAAEGKAVLLTTHMMGLAQRLADQICVMDKGRQLAYAPTSHLLRQFQIRETVEVKIGTVLTPVDEQALQVQFPAVTAVAHNGETHVSWPNPEQWQIVQLYSYLDGQGHTIQSVQRRDADLEEIFLSLIGQETAV